MELKSFDSRNDIYNSDSSGDEIQTKDSIPLNSIPPNQPTPYHSTNQNLEHSVQSNPVTPQNLNQLGQTRPYFQNTQQYQIPPQPLYPQQPNNYFIPPNNYPYQTNNLTYNNQNIMAYNQQMNAYNAPKPFNNQNNIVVKSKEKLTKRQRIYQIIMIVLLFFYSISELILTIIYEGLNYGIIDDIFIIIFAIIILVYTIYGLTATHILLAVCAFIVLVIGLILKILVHNNNDLQSYPYLTYFINFRIFLTFILCVFFIPGKYKRRRTTNKKTIRVYS